MSSSQYWAYERGVLYVLDLTDPPADFVLPHTPPKIDASFETLQDDSVDALAAAMGLATPDVVAQRLETGRRCVVGWFEGQIVAYGWISHDAECVGELEREFRMQPFEAYIWQCVTIPEFRRQGLYTALLTHINHLLADENIHRIWIGTSVHNKPSLKGIVRAGYVPTVTVAYRRIWALRWMRIAPMPDASHAAIERAIEAYQLPHERKFGSSLISFSPPPAQPVVCAQLGVEI